MPATRPALAPAAARLPVRFPSGLPGFPGLERFVLTERPTSAPFVFLAAPGRRPVTLPLLPLEALADLAPDAARTAGLLGLGPAQRAYAVAAIGPGGRPVTVNLRAPVVIDVRARVGWQRLLDDERLPLAARVL